MKYAWTRWHAWLARKRGLRAFLVFVLSTFAGPAVAAAAVFCIRGYFRGVDAGEVILAIFVYIFGVGFASVAGILCGIHCYWRRGIGFWATLAYAFVSVASRLGFPSGSQPFYGLVLFSAAVCYGLGWCIGIFGRARPRTG